MTPSMFAEGRPATDGLHGLFGNAFPINTTGTTGDRGLRRYLSRRKESKVEAIPYDDAEQAWVGYHGPWAFVTTIVFLSIPVAYIYILLILLRELCLTFPESVYQRLQHYIPLLAGFISAMQQSSRIVEVWCVVEAVFFLALKFYIWWLQSRDTLEACLSSAPIMGIQERQSLWNKMWNSETMNVNEFLSGWFFDESIEKISRYDVFDLLAWAMFEGRHQEHLTTVEHGQLEAFFAEAEHRVSLYLHGARSENNTTNLLPQEEKKQENGLHVQQDESLSSPGMQSPSRSSPQQAAFYAFQKVLPQPKQWFHFSEVSELHERNFFSELFESYRARYENLDFTPVKDLQTTMANAAHDLRHVVEERIEKAEESAMATARHVYEEFVPSGSQIDKNLAAMSYATQLRLTEAWNSAKNMKGRLETARFLSNQRKAIGDQLHVYRLQLNRMIETSSSSVPTKQMAGLMRRITECYEAAERLEGRAQNAFSRATGYAFQNIPFLQGQQQPQRFAKYSADPLLGVATFPLGFHLTVFSLTELPLRYWMAKRGFERRVVGPVAYYFHPGTEQTEQRTPIVFVHGIGVGLVTYLPLVDKLLSTGRPIFLPELPFVSAFRPWQSPQSVLQPHVVCHTMSVMLASHGFLQATWLGHSYGTSWISYMCKFASHAVAAAMFLDPICFCLHAPRLTKSFVYMPADPGTISYFVRTDLIVNWTIQRAFPWSWIILFVEEINVPCTVFLSEKDALVPSARVEAYFRSSGVPVTNVTNVTRNHFQSEESLINCCIFEGHGHGGWTESYDESLSVLHSAVEVLCERAEATPSVQEQ